MATVGVISISHDTLKRIGGSEDSVKLPPESGGGYMGALEIVHQLHCVVSSDLPPTLSHLIFFQNLLWQATNAEYYKNRSLAWTDRPETLRQHLGGKRPLRISRFIDLPCFFQITVRIFCVKN